MKNKYKLILLATILITIIIFLNQAVSPQNYFKRTIEKITEEEKVDEINAPNDFIKLIESVYTFSENNGYKKPEFYFSSTETKEIEGIDYYSIAFVAVKAKGDGTAIDYKRLHIFVEMNRDFFNWSIVDYRILENNFID